MYKDERDVLIPEEAAAYLTKEASARLRCTRPRNHIVKTRRPSEPSSPSQARLSALPSIPDHPSRGTRLRLLSSHDKRLSLRVE